MTQKSKPIIIDFETSKKELQKTFKKEFQIKLKIFTRPTQVKSVGSIKREPTTNSQITLLITASLPLTINKTSDKAKW